MRTQGIGGDCRPPGARAAGPFTLEDGPRLVAARTARLEPTVNPLVFLALYIAFGVALLVAILTRKRDGREQERAIWQAAAVELGLELRAPTFTQAYMSGQLDGLSVEVDEVRHDDALHPRLSVNLSVPMSMQLSARSGNADLQTGDERFDSAARVSGEETEVLARLGEPARSALSPLLSRGARLEYGKLRLVLSAPAAGARDLAHAVRTLAHAGGLLQLGEGGVPAALARNAVSDSDPRVRLLNLTALFRHHPQTESAREAAAKALEDVVPVIRLRAAQFLPGSEPAAALSALMRTTAEPWVRVEALRELDHKRPYAEISTTVAAALDAAEEELRREAVKVIARAGDREKVDALAAMAAGAAPPLAETLAEALGQLGGPRAEEALMRLLAHESTPVRCQAARALGEMGTVRAVEPLLPLTRGLLGGELQQAARDAVRRIQARLGNVEAGHLAVVDDQHGAVSLPDPVGAVAVVEDAAAKRERSGQ